MLAAMSDPGPAFASLTADDHVTGEAVALDLPPASIGSRILSGFLDYLIVWVATFTLVSAGAAMHGQQHLGSAAHVLERDGEEQLLKVVTGARSERAQLGVVAI